jgi:hypothetical protein
MQRKSVQYRCKERLRSDGSKDTQASSDEESEVEVEEVEKESDDKFCDRTTAPVHQVGGTGWEQGYVGAALPATAAGAGSLVKRISGC